MIVLGARYLVQLPAPEATSAGGILLPDAAQETVYDGAILAAGLGRVLNNGRPYPMQAATGDRAVTNKAGFQWWSEEERTGFVADSALIARIPAPYFDTLLPCGDFVLIAPDRLYGREPETGATVKVTEGGVLMATSVMAGNEEWAEREGKAAYAEGQRLWESPEWREDPPYYRHRRLHGYLDGLHPDVRRVCVRIGKFRREGPEFERRWVRKELPLRGDVVAVGPGRLLSDGSRKPASLEPGDIVHWSAAHTAQVLWSGDREVLAIESRFLDAVETLEDEERLAA